jgi:3-oxoacyl-[acyl-carrier protein] reductase
VPDLVQTCLDLMIDKQSAIWHLSNGEALSWADLARRAAAQAPLLAPRGICVNAIAPGFIETAMTAKLPFITREVGSRLNALMQAGQPRDAAELVAFLSTPGASGISGETVRVCGQGMMGA